MEREVVCKECGETFRTSSQNADYCSQECIRIHIFRRKMATEKPKKKVQSIEKINREARNAGMTYGKYVALND